MLVVMQPVVQKDTAEDFAARIFDPIDKVRASTLAWIKGAMIAEAVRCTQDICTWCRLARTDAKRVREAVMVDGEWLHCDERDHILGRCNAGPIHQRLYNQRAIDRLEPKFPGFSADGSIGVQADLSLIPMNNAGALCGQCHGGGKDRNFLHVACNVCGGSGRVLDDGA